MIFRHDKGQMHNKGWADAIGCVFMVILSLLLGMAVSGLMVYFAWNFAISPVFSLSKITFIKAIFIGLLISGVFNGFRVITSEDFI